MNVCANTKRARSADGVTVPTDRQTLTVSDSGVFTSGRKRGTIDRLDTEVVTETGRNSYLPNKNLEEDSQSDQLKEMIFPSSCKIMVISPMTKCKDTRTRKGYYELVIT